MEGFIRINDTLINTSRLISVRHFDEEKREDGFTQTPHYLAVFDTGQKLMLPLEAGALLMDQCPTLVARG